MTRHLPNALTAARILLTPFIGWLLAAGEPRAALTLLAAAALTDAADGWLARRLDARSPLGAFLDPLADKLLAATVYLGLAASGRLPVWLAVLVLGRDVLILAFAAWALGRRRLRSFPPSLWGKLSTVLQFSLGVACLVHAVRPAAWSAAAVRALIPAVALATAWSGAQYAWTARLRLRQWAD